MQNKNKNIRGFKIRIWYGDEMKPLFWVNIIKVYLTLTFMTLEIVLIILYN